MIIGQAFVTGARAMRLTRVREWIALGMFHCLRCAMPLDVATLPGSKDYIREELRGLGPMKTEEKWGLVLFTVAVALADGPCAAVGRGYERAQPYQGRSSVERRGDRQCPMRN